MPKSAQLTRSGRYFDWFRCRECEFKTKDFADATDHAMDSAHQVKGICLDENDPNFVHGDPRYPETYLEL